jgi:hypothetical protein
VIFTIANKPELEAQLEVLSDSGSRTMTAKGTTAKYAKQAKKGRHASALVLHISFVSRLFICMTI